LIQISASCLAAFLAAAASAALAAAAAPSAAVETVLLRQQELRDVVPAFGTVAASEESMADISFPHSGQITGLKVRAAQKVRAGDPLVTITADPATLQGYQKAVTALDFAKRELQRQQTLRAQHLATNAQVATAQQAVSDATVALETERRLGNDQPTKTATAPFDGYVLQIMSAPGDRLQANTAILKLTRTDQGLRVSAGLKPEDAGRVAPGMPAEITPVLGAQPQPLAGTVRQIGGSINPTSKLVDCWIDIMRAGSLVSGSSASVAIIVSRHQGWVVPRNAVLHDAKGSYIFQVENEHAKRVDVRTGIETNDLTEIAGEFNPSLKVVSLGNYELRDGMAVRESPTK
jgi:RND family efflux transporter MFP subunit